MTGFSEAIAQAIATASVDLHDARQQDDVDGVIVHEGRLEELHRLAADHGLGAA